METDPNPAANNTPPAKQSTPDLTAFLVEALALTPAEGAEAVTEEQIREALTAAIQAGKDAAAGSEATTELQTQLATLQSANAELQAKYDAAAGELATLKQAGEEKELDALLEPYGDRISDDAARSAIREMLKSNRDAGLALLKGLPPTGAAASPAGDPPPAPMHDPSAGSGAAPDESAKADAIGRLAKKLQADNAGMTFASAWSQAEKEIAAKVAAGEPIS